MAEQGALVVFDPLVLADALSGGSSDEQVALEALKSYCSHRLITDDGDGKLSEAYREELGPSFEAIQNLLLAEVPREKRVQRGGPASVGQISGLRKQHDDFFKAALAVRPDILVFRVRQWERKSLIARVKKDYGVQLLSPREYVTYLG